ncbi:hypothetical protein M409DRAFT_60317 [Zasmidium cellare ATCC 36951]|uniref:Uncharacterized protein n=1 Tax=Zasmidium cellare ATCC 36951 TaxID=1080233 RepID=A0A6A6BZC1_ZASCE|nr:uncharacterized protein M409DRAFT_60317 [Zasmidium cellare ATCC 36951]KAF2160065.1 hypothetical protein M409DRAFT_60317 [Zasmidium cellare ATCC 36951]
MSTWATMKEGHKFLFTRIELLAFRRPAVTLFPLLDDLAANYLVLQKHSAFVAGGRSRFVTILASSGGPGTSWMITASGHFVTALQSISSSRSLATTQTDRPSCVPDRSRWREVWGFEEGGGGGMSRAPSVVAVKEPCWGKGVAQLVELCRVREPGPNLPKRRLSPRWRLRGQPPHPPMLTFAKTAHSDTSLHALIHDAPTPSMQPKPAAHKARSASDGSVNMSQAASSPPKSPYDPGPDTHRQRRSSQTPRETHRNRAQPRESKQRVHLRASSNVAIGEGWGQERTKQKSIAEM